MENQNKTIAVRCNDARGAGWLTAKIGDVLTADGWGCSSDRPYDCGSGLYGWQVSPAPDHAQGDGWNGCGVTGREWVAWESVDPERVAILSGKVASYQVRIVRGASDPVDMLAWIRSQGYTPPSDLVYAARTVQRWRWGWTERLAAVVLHEARYREITGGGGWPISREDYAQASSAPPSEWSHPFAQAVATGGWDEATGAIVAGVSRYDAADALARGWTVAQAWTRRMGGAVGDTVRAWEIRRAMGGAPTLDAAEEALRDMDRRRGEARIGRARAVDASGEADGAPLRSAERGMSARSVRRSVAVWYRGAIVGWVTPYRAERLSCDPLTTVSALRAKVKRAVKPPDRYVRAPATTADALIKRAQAAIKRRGWSVEQYQSSAGGGWGRSASYSMRCVDRVHGVTIAQWSRGTAPTVDAALTILDTDRAMRAVKA